jgi:hypothetical protein
LDNLQSLASIGALYQEYAPGDFVLNSNRDLQFFKLVSDTLNHYYPKVRYVKILKDNYQVMLSELNKKRILQSSPPPEATIPNLVLPGPNGKKISLLSMNERYVLLSFWSVNQEESIRNVLSLKEIYPRYRNRGFEVYQVALEKSIEKWKNALVFEEIEWVSVCDTGFPNSTTRYVYNVNSVPMNYLIDMEKQEILNKNISPPDLAKTLDYLLLQ